jgi:hypothetical protein
MSLNGMCEGTDGSEMAKSENSVAGLFGLFVASVVAAGAVAVEWVGYMEALAGVVMVGGSEYGDGEEGMET